MPFYRITIELSNNRTTQGIRYFEQTNIDVVNNIIRVKAKQHYGENNVVDVEAAMLSNHSTAVKEYRAKLERRKENKKFNDGIDKGLGITKSRKDIYKDSTKNTMGERDKNKLP